MTTPTWTEGEPDNLQAAAMDACEWLKHMQSRPKTFELSDINWDRLDRCIEALQGFVDPQSTPPNVHLILTTKANYENPPLP